MNVNSLKDFQAFEPDQEIKAFIYQQVHELEHEIKDLGDVTVLVEKREEKNLDSDQITDIRYAVTFTIDPNGMNLFVRSDEDDVISACMAAKAKLKSKLHKIINYSSSEERSTAIDAAISSSGYLH